MNRLTLPSALAAIAIFIASPASAAQILYAVSGAGNAASNLYTVNPLTGAATLVGATGFSHITGLAFSPVTGVLFGHISDLGVSVAALVTINTATGAATVIGSTGIQVPDMTFNSAGILYAWGELDEFGNDDDLYTIDTGTALATNLGDSTINTSQTGLAFAPSGDLYLKPNSSELQRIDPLTGLPIPGSLISLNDGTDNALTFSSNGLAYSIIRSGGTSFLVTIDLATGNVAEIGDMGVARIAALAFSPDDRVVPEPGSVVLQVSGLAALAVFGRRMRGRRQGPSDGH